MDLYERERFVGRGACGSAYVCRRLADSKRVVIKEIAIEMNEFDRETTLNEIKVLSMLHHPNIIEYYDSFVHDKSMMIVMEYASGGTLFDLLESRASDQMSYLDEEEIGHLFAQIVLPLHMVHSNNILHRDLKTKNIFLTGSLDFVKIGDFGISKILSSKSKAYTVVGTPSYISPELCEGKPYNYKSDVWSLGCILYEMCSLKRAFEAPNLPALVLKIMRGTVEPLPLHYSTGLRQMLASMLALNPKDRPDLVSLLSHHWLTPHVFRLPTCLGVLPCTARPPRPLSATQHEDLRISLRDSTSFKNTKVKSLFSSGASTTIFTGIASDNKFDVERICLSDREVSDFVQICLSQDDHNDAFGVTRGGKVFHWTIHPSTDNNPKLRILDQLVSIRIVKVATGNGFICLLTDRGILMTKGSGTGGCLGHGNEEASKKPKIVDTLLGEEVLDVACGTKHVAALTHHHVHTWGRNRDGCLGIGATSPALVSRPEPVALQLEEGEHGEKVICGSNVSGVVTNRGRLMVAGNFRQTSNHHFIDQTPSEIKIQDTAFGNNYTIYLTQDGGLLFDQNEIKVPKVKMMAFSKSSDGEDSDFLLVSTFGEDSNLIKINSNPETPIRISSLAMCTGQEDNPETRQLPPSIVSISISSNRFCVAYSIP